jgi:creatinine amidohydrolase
LVGFLFACRDRVRIPPCRDEIAAARAKERNMGPTHVTWKRYQELRPDELAAVVRDRPVAFWPLGLLEHHGWHLPVGLDGLKAEHICARIAERTGGVLLPTMWWGAGGGHGDFMWTHYQAEEAAESILARTVQQLVAFGFRAIVLLAGHYPWRGIMNRHLPALQEAHPEILFLWGTEMEIGGEVRLPGDHAAREETSYGLALFPDLVDPDALRPGHTASAWPGGQEPPVEARHPRVCFDPNEPLFAQMGQDARTASAERGEEAIARLVDRLAGQINRHLGR